MAARRAAEARARRAAEAENAAGNALFSRGDNEGALQRYQNALVALEAARDAHGELPVAGEEAAAVCHSNVLACLLKLGRSEDAYAAARRGLALPAGAANVALAAKLWARAAAALDALGETDSPRAVEAKCMPARLGLPPLGLPSAADQAALNATRTAVRGVIDAMFSDPSRLRTQDVLRSRVLSRFAPAAASSGLHVNARDESGMPPMFGFVQGLLDSPRADARVPTAWLLRQLLALGADPNARWADGRTALMYVAHAGDAPAALEAARVLIEAGARVNARDAKNWTPLMCVLSTEDRPPSWRCARMVRLLLAAGADAASCGAPSAKRELAGVETPLLLLAARSMENDDQEEALDVLVDALLGNGAALAARDAFGQTAAALVRRCGATPRRVRAFAVIAAAMRVSGAGAHADADEHSVEWVRLFNVAVDANNAVAARGLADDAAGAAREQRTLAALMRDAELPGSRHGACEADANPYLTLFRHVTSRLPSACWALYDAPPDEASPEGGALRITSRIRAPEAEADSVELAALPSLALLSGSPPRFIWAGMRSFTEFVAEPCRHGFAFAVPSDEALDALAALSPLLEVGAGTGYWAALLRRRGADVLATDAAPPDGAGTLSNPFHVAPFPGGRVQPGDGAAMAAAHPERALVLMYPYSHETASQFGDDVAAWDVRALAAYRGDIVAHVGALRWRRPRAEAEAAQLPPHFFATDREAGDTTSRGAQEALRRDFACVKTVPLPRWPLHEDALTIWVRKDKLPPGFEAGKAEHINTAAEADALLAARPGVCAAGPGCACERCGAARAAGDLCARPECGARSRSNAAALKRCGACLRAAYCSVDCQKSDWKRRKPECKAAARVEYE